MRELTFGEICLFGIGRFAVQDFIAMRMPPERRNDGSNVAGLIDQRRIDRSQHAWRGCGYVFSQADQSIDTLQMIRAFAMPQWQAKHDLEPRRLK